MELVLSNNNGVSTMTSLQLVEYINHLRKEESPLGYTELQHKSFMEKVQKVLKDTAINFATSFYKGNGSAVLERKVAIFPKREAMLMAMSYSYDIQAVVYDAWETAEKNLSKAASIVLPNFLDPAESAIAWAAQYKEKQAAQLELAGVKLVVAENAPKVNFYESVVNHGLCYTLSEAAKLLGTGRTRFSEYLKENGYMAKDRTPYQQHLNSKIMEVKLQKYIEPHTGIEHITATPFITGKGLTHFQKKLNVPATTNTMANCPVSVVNSTITKTSITSSLNKHNAAVQRKLKGL